MASLSADTETIRVANVDVMCPTRWSGRLHLVLHISPRNGPGSKAWNDLRRGIEVVDPGTWEQAAELAKSLGIAHEVGYRLSLMPDAGPLVSRLQLQRAETSLYAAMRLEGDGHDAGVVSLLKLSAQDGVASPRRIRPREAVSFRRGSASALPTGARGVAGLACARIWRPMSCAIGLPASFLAWCRDRPRR